MINLSKKSLKHKKFDFCPFSILYRNNGQSQELKDYVLEEHKKNRLLKEFQITFYTRLKKFDKDYRLNKLESYGKIVKKILSFIEGNYSNLPLRNYQVFEEYRWLRIKDEIDKLGIQDSVSSYINPMVVHKYVNTFLEKNGEQKYQLGGKPDILSKLPNKKNKSIIIEEIRSSINPFITKKIYNLQLSIYAIILKKNGYNPTRYRILIIDDLIIKEEKITSALINTNLKLINELIKNTQSIYFYETELLFNGNSDRCIWCNYYPICFILKQ